MTENAIFRIKNYGEIYTKVLKNEMENSDTWLSYIYNIVAEHCVNNNWIDIVCESIMYADNCYIIEISTTETI